MVQKEKIVLKTILIMQSIDQRLGGALPILKPTDPPYSVFQTFGIEEYKIIDANGNTVIENEMLEMPMVDGSTAKVKIPLNDISEGTYKLVVSKLIGGAKAEQPLVLSGNWECEFAY